MFDISLETSLAPEFNYSSYEYKTANSDVLQESTAYRSKVMLLEYTSNSLEIEMLVEDAREIKNKIIEAINRLIQIISDLSTKFQNMALSLVGRNKKWIDSTKELLKPESIPDNFKYEIYPYWNFTTKLFNYNIPEFNEKDEEFLKLLGDAEGFRHKYFKDLYVTVDGKSVYDPKLALRGGKEERISINKATLVSKLDDIFEYIVNYSDNAKKIVVRNTSIIDLLKRAMSSIRNAPVMESVDDFINQVEYLLEAGGENKDEPATSSSVNEDPNKEDKRTDGQQPTAGVKNVAISRQQYSKLCYEVNSARMTVSESAYNDYIRLLMSARKSAKK